MRKSKALKNRLINLIFFSVLTWLVLPFSSFAQLNAKIQVNVTQGCTPLMVNFAHTGTQGDSIICYWFFGDGGSATGINTSHNFLNGGLFTTMLIVQNNKKANDFDTAYVDINAIQTPSAQLTLNKTLACVREDIIVQFPGSLKDSLRLNFGDGTISKDKVNYQVHQYNSNGIFQIKLNTYYKTCSDSSTRTVTIDGPISSFTVSEDSACVDENITFRVTSKAGASSIMWDFGDGTTSTIDTVTHRYAIYGDIKPKLFVYGSRTCELPYDLHVYHVEAGIGYNENTLFCDGRNILFNNLSTGNVTNHWDFGNGTNSNMEIPTNIRYQPGTYIIELAIANRHACVDTTHDTITIYALPDIQLGEDWFACEGESVTLFASGGDKILWTPSTFLNNPSSYTPTVQNPTYTIPYNAIVTDTNTSCFNTGVILVEVQPRPDWNVQIEPPSDTIIVGRTDTIQVNLNGDYIYSWTSEDTIVSYTKTQLIVQPLAARNEIAYYHLLVKDPRECFDYTETVEIFVRDEYAFGVPNAFTPNGDNKNDVIKVNGWGIKRLIEFRVFNRWGTEVFFTDDIENGWDGTVNGKPQPIDSYAYRIKVELWNDTIEEKSGMFTLVR